MALGAGLWGLQRWAIFCCLPLAAGAALLHGYAVLAGRDPLGLSSARFVMMVAVVWLLIRAVPGLAKGSEIPAPIRWWLSPYFYVPLLYSLGAAGLLLQTLHR